MTQEFVTLPREVVEQALEALINEGEFRKLIKPLIEKSIDSIRAALEQPQRKLTQQDIADSALLGNIESPFNACMHQEHCKRWKKEAEAEQQFSARDDAERLKSVARGMSYNDHGEAVWKHTLMEIAVRLEAGGYAAPQPPTVKECLTVEQPQVEREPVAKVVLTEQLGLPCLQWLDLDRQFDFKGGELLYTHPQPKREPVGEAGPMPGADGFTMACFRASDVSVGTELYTRPQPKQEPLTDEEIDKLCPQFDDPMRREMWIIGFKAAHNIK